jgi:hypothetical protein
MRKFTYTKENLEHLEILQMMLKQTPHFIPSFEDLLTFPDMMVKYPVCRGRVRGEDMA